MLSSKKLAALRNEDGIGLLFALFAALVVLGAATLVITHVNGAKTGSDRSVNQVALDEAAKAGLDAGISQFWGGFFAQLDGDAPSLLNYRTYLSTWVADNPDGVNIPIDVPGLNTPISMQRGMAAVQRVTVDRVDDATGTTLTFRSLASLNGAQRAASQTVRVGGSLFEGFEFAVLANNINCILCHADFRNALLEWNTNTATRPTSDVNGNGKQDWIDNLGTFERIKVASLESLMVRPSEADSYLAGTMFTGGSLYDNTGKALSSLDSTTFKGWGFSHGQTDPTDNGLITQNASTGAMTTTNLTAAKETDGELDQWANLYMGDQIEGLVPDKFPAPYQDDGGGSSSAVASEVNNRLVDDSEFSVTMESTEGTITGGIKYGVANGSTYSGSALPTTGNTTTISGKYNGNMILIGTTANPIIIDGSVAINGDLVLKGVVRGRGQLMTRRNVYIMGDVTYDDNATLTAAGKPFGVHNNSDGTKTENLLGVVSGGNILMGDYLTVRGKNSTSNTDKYPDTAFSIDVRSTTKTGTMNSQTMYYGYFDPGVIDANEYQAKMTLANGTQVNRDGQQVSFTSSELMLFNKLELEKTLAKRMAGEDYTARFYGLRESQPGNIYMYDYTDEHTVRYDENGVGKRVKKLTDWVNALTPSNSKYTSAQITMMKDIMTKSKTLYMNPKSNWISENTLRKGWYDDEMARTSKKPWKFDGLLYSNNAIFAQTKSNDRHKSNTYGMMELKGGIVAPDLGMLVAGGLDLFYDARVKDLLNIEDTSDVQLTRRIFRYVNPVEVAAAQGGDQVEGD